MNHVYENLLDACNFLLALQRLGVFPSHGCEVNLCNVVLQINLKKQDSNDSCSSRSICCQTQSLQRAVHLPFT